MIVRNVSDSDVVQLFLRFRKVLNRPEAIKSNVEDTYVENCTLSVGRYIRLLQLMPFGKVIVVYCKLTQLVQIVHLGLY
jgi:hypothetical protein